MAYQSDLIFDIGLHKGEDTRYYLAKGFRVVAVEASPALARDAEDVLRESVQSGQLTIVQVAISKREGPVRLYTSSASEWNTTLPDWNRRNQAIGATTLEIIEVPGMCFESLIKRYGVPYFLKIDIEGADMLCLEGLHRPDIPRFVSIESNKTDWIELRREFDVLQALGYRRFKVVPQQRMHSQVPPEPAREGKYVAWRFEHMSSGMFGDEAPGRWMSAREALALYRSIFLRYRMFGDDGRLRGTRRGILLQTLLRGPGWYDTHAAC